MVGNSVRTFRTRPIPKVLPGGKKIRRANTGLHLFDDACIAQPRKAEKGRVNGEGKACSRKTGKRATAQKKRKGKKGETITPARGKKCKTRRKSRGIGKNAHAGEEKRERRRQDIAWNQTELSPSYSEKKRKKFNLTSWQRESEEKQIRLGALSKGGGRGRYLLLHRRNPSEKRAATKHPPSCEDLLLRAERDLRKKKKRYGEVASPRGAVPNRE